MQNDEGSHAWPPKRTKPGRTKKFLQLSQTFRQLMRSDPRGHMKKESVAERSSAMTNLINLIKKAQLKTGGLEVSGGDRWI